MRVQVRLRNLEHSNGLEHHVQQRASYALSKFGQRIQRVVARFEDLNGPKGGVDKRCSIAAVGSFGMRIVEATGADCYAAADRAMEILERSLARAVGRNRIELGWATAQAVPRYDKAN